MSINKFNSCERNNYFFGKLMTVKDFENEQTYFNSKRQLCNSMLHGFGIVSGLKVFLVNNQTVSVDAGLAIDRRGREIMVPESTVKKISVIDGFDDCCDSKKVYLALKYKENLEETTFSIVSSGKSNDVNQEYNRIHEGYQLFLTDKEPEKKDVNLQYLMYEEKYLYNQDGVSIKVILPKYANPSKMFKVTVVFEKSNISAPVNFKFNLSGEFFKSIDDKKEVTVEYKETEISTFKTYKKDYYVYCDAVTDTLTDIVVKKKHFSLSLGNKELPINSDIKSPVVITEQKLKEVLINQYYSLDLDSQLSSNEDSCIYLAKLNLVSNHSDYFIEAFENNPFNQYLIKTQMMDMFDDLVSESTALQPSDAPLRQIVQVKERVVQEPAPVAQAPAVEYITGVEEISMGFYPKVGKAYFSNEFVHGLGYGQIGVVAALENPENITTGEEHLFCFGDMGIFAEELSISSPNVDIAAISNPDKGTMKLGIKLLDKTEQTSVKIRWWAFKPSNNQADGDTDVLLDDSVKVIVTPPTAQVEPLGQYRFSAQIEGSSSQEIKWYMAEEGTGTIDSNGLYTAPSKEGVYEVRAQSVKFENKFASAYIVVSTY